jgi:hypothetical protein
MHESPDGYGLRSDPGHWSQQGGCECYGQSLVEAVAEVDAAMASREAERQMAATAAALVADKECRLLIAGGRRPADDERFESLADEGEDAPSAKSLRRQWAVDDMENGETTDMVVMANGDVVVYAVKDGMLSVVCVRHC